MYSPDDFDTFGIKTTTRPFPSWRMNNYFVHQHSQHLVFFRRACAIPLLLNAFGIGPWGQVGKILRDVLNGLESVRRFALRCGDRHQAEAILSAGTFQPGDLIGASVGRALWSDGGPAKPVQFYEVKDEIIASLVCFGFR